MPNDNTAVDANPFVLYDARLYELAPRMVTTARPFSEDDLRAFVAAGEHSGLV